MKILKIIWGPFNYLLDSGHLFALLSAYNGIKMGLEGNTAAAIAYIILLMFLVSMIEKDRKIKELKYLNKYLSMAVKGIHEKTRV